MRFSSIVVGGDAGDPTSLRVTSDPRYPGVTQMSFIRIRPLGDNCKSALMIYRSVDGTFLSECVDKLGYNWKILRIVMDKLWSDWTTDHIASDNQE